MNREPVLIAGTGALATLFAARLAAIDVPVTLLGSWRDGIEALNARGARLIGTGGGEQSHAVRAISDLRECENANLALVLVKAWQTERAAVQLARCLAENGLALTLQNGLGNRETLAAALGASRVALGITTGGATQLGPGLVREGGEGIITIEGHPRIGRLADLLREAGFQVELVRDARALVWGKLVINAAINPLTALLHISNGELLKRPAAREVMGALAGEAAAVAGALGIGLTFSDPVSAVEEVAQRTAANYSSMFQDVQRGSKTEIDAICGAVVRAGQTGNVPTPLNRTMWQLIRALSPA